jgi:uncharacterized protein
MLAAAGALLLCLALPVAAADFGALKPQGYVNDFAGVLRKEAVEELNDYCARVEKTTGVQMAFVLLPSLQGEPIEDVANLLFRKWGVGHRGQNDGLLLLISVGDRRTRLEVGYGLEPIIPDGYAGWVLREMRPALRAGDYHGALLAAAETLAARIATAKGVRLEGSPARRRTPPGDDALPWPWVAGVIAASVLLLASRRRRRPGPQGTGFWPAVWYDASFPTRGSGGFGGFDSSDSFGGFGGGDSGGGGASSDW